MATRQRRLFELDEKWRNANGEASQAELNEALKLLVAEYTGSPENQDTSHKEAPMSLEAIKSTLTTAVSDAVDQAYAQGVEDTKAAQTPVDPTVPTPDPVDVDKIAKDNFQAGVVEENRRVLGIVEAAIGSHESTDEKLKADLKLA